jgi:hypothetical protein
MHFEKSFFASSTLAGTRIDRDGRMTGRFCRSLIRFRLIGALWVVGALCLSAPAQRQWGVSAKCIARGFCKSLFSVIHCQLGFATAAHL